MQIKVESRVADGERIREVSVERLRFALRRLLPAVLRARVQFSDVNGPRGGLDKRCQVQLERDGGGAVVATSLASDWRTALERALKRVTQALARRLMRGRRPVRGRLAKQAFLGGPDMSLVPVPVQRTPLRRTRR